MNKIEIGMKIKSTKTGNTYIVDNIDKVNNRIYLNCENDNDQAESHILSKVIEYIENGYYEIVKEMLEVIDDGFGRVLIKSNKPFGKHGYTENWVKVNRTKKGNFVIIDKNKINLKDLKHELYILSNESNETVSSFIYTQK